MTQGTYPLAAAMINQLNRVDTISNNLANANTVGYKQAGLTEGSFNNYLDKAIEKNKPTTELNVVTNTIPKLDSKFINGELGPVEQTGNGLDFALKHNDTFFKVQNANGDVVLTRDGSFKVVDNLLVTSDNYPVLNAENEPIAVEDGINILQQLGIAQTSYDNLENEGRNNYRIKENAAVNFNVAEDNSTVALQGALEKSNVNAVSAMVELIDAHRRFEQAQKAVTSIGETNAKLIEKLSAK